MTERLSLGGAKKTCGRKLFCGFALPYCGAEIFFFFTLGICSCCLTESFEEQTEGPKEPFSSFSGTKFELEFYSFCSNGLILLLGNLHEK